MGFVSDLLIHGLDEDRLGVSPMVLTLGTLAALVVATLVLVAAGNHGKETEERSLPPRWRTKHRKWIENRCPAFRIAAVDRTEMNFDAGLKSFELEDDGEETTVEAVVQQDDIVLYCFDKHEDCFVFVQVQNRAKLELAPFLDRSIRKFAVVGGKLVVVPFQEMNNWAHHIDTHDWTVTWIWNTGRCASTLAHRALAAAGVGSVSEPFWFEQLTRILTDAKKGSRLEEHMGDVARIAHVVEFFQVQSYRRGLGVQDACTADKPLFSMNPKGSGTYLKHIVIKHLSKQFPHQRHVFMYRDCRKVVESFGSIFVVGSVVTGKGGPPPKPPKFVSRAMNEHKDKLPMEFSYWSHPAAKRITLMWMDGVCDWMEFLTDHQVDQLTIRMDEFVTKNMENRRATLFELLKHAGLPLKTQWNPTVDNSLGAFKEHSQKGSVMEKSSAVTKKKFLDTDAEEKISACVSTVPYLGALGGADLILPGSVGRPRLTVEDGHNARTQSYYTKMTAGLPSVMDP